MPTLRVQLDVQLDGNSLSGFPYTRSMTVDRAQVLDTLIAAGGTLPSVVNLITTLQCLLLRAIDQPITVTLNGVGPVVAKLNAGGLLLLLDCNQLGDAAASNNTVTVPGANTGEVSGVAIGS